MNTFMESTVDGMVKRITEAKNEAVKRGIEANVCVINEKYAYVEPFDIPTCCGTSKSPAMIAGMRLFSTNVAPDRVEFLLFESKNVTPTYLELLAENERLKEVEKKYNALKELFKEGL
jgi:hypothetical protein